MFSNTQFLLYRITRNWLKVFVIHLLKPDKFKDNTEMENWYFDINLSIKIHVHTFKLKKLAYSYLWPEKDKKWQYENIFTTHSSG